MPVYPQALFLDRDGTLIEWVDYLSDPADVRAADGVGGALRRAKGVGCLLFLHTNQSGVGRGYFGMDQVEAVNQEMYRQMGVDEAFFDGVCIATDHPDSAGADSYRKPSPRFELEMIDRFSLNPNACYMIGDSLSDLETGLNAGMGSIWIESGRPDEQLPSGAAGYGSLREFVEAALA